MDKTAATQLATRLHEQLGGKVVRVRAEQVNPYSGDASIGWATRVVKEDGEVVDVIGNDQSGFSTMQRAGGFVSLDRIVAELLDDSTDPVLAELDDVSPPNDDDLAERVTVVAVKLAEVAAEVRAIRDELVLRSKR